MEPVCSFDIGFIVEKARALWQALKNRGRRPDAQGQPDPRHPDGEGPDDLQAPSAIVEPRPANMRDLSPQLGTAMARAHSGTVLYQATTVDPKQVTRNLLSSHPDASYDRASRRLTLPAVSSGALEHSQSLQQLGQTIAQETGVSAGNAEEMSLLRNVLFNVEVQRESRNMLFSPMVLELMREGVPVRDCLARAHGQGLHPAAPYGGCCRIYAGGHVRSTSVVRARWRRRWRRGSSRREPPPSDRPRRALVPGPARCW